MYLIHTLKGSLYRDIPMSGYPYIGVSPYKGFVIKRAPVNHRTAPPSVPSRKVPEYGDVGLVPPLIVLWGSLIGAPWNMVGQEGG